MSPAAVVTIIAALLAVVVVAAYLIRIASILGRVNAKLRAITGRLHVIAEKTEPAGPIVKEMNRDLAGVNEALLRVLAK
ncbi:MAG: hypothetical protein WA317_03720 [Mycobacterium sp.]|uniref:hypothetical protein n=1 Tax=Mycobacterium sp. TaxID=1785 RepID=UPI003CC68ABE